MAGIASDFKGVAAVSPGMGMGKEHGTVLDREHNGHFNDVLFYDGAPARKSVRALEQRVTSLEGAGFVASAGASTDNNLVRWDGASGDVIQNSVVNLTDGGNLSGVVDLTATGMVELSGNVYPGVTGTNGQVLTTNGAGTLSWATNAGGDASGPASSTDDALARFDGTTGKIIQSSAGILNDLGDLSGIRNLAATGTAILSGNTYPTVTGTTGQFLSTNGAGTLSWASNANGDVVGPVSSTDNAIARFDGTTGKTLQNSAVTVSDTGNVAGVVNLTATGTVALSGNTLPTTTGTNGQNLTTNGAGTTSWSTPSIAQAWLGTTLSTGVRMWCGSGTTSGGALSLHVTQNGLSGGTGIFTTLSSCHFQLTCSRNTTSNTEAAFAYVQNVSSNTVNIQAKAGNSGPIVLAGTYVGLQNALDGTTVYLLVIGT